ncbi:MAG: hypothetical protein ACXVA4_10080 [Ktedonobacterales bacterium]
MLWRHGDVLIQSIDDMDDVPAGGQRQSEPVLAYGEVTGHRHRVEDANTAELWRVNDTLYLKVIDVARIVHEEHAPIELPPGLYRVWQQREYVPPNQRGSTGTSFRTVVD